MTTESSDAAIAGTTNRPFRSAVITGGASGIGRALATRLTAAGTEVVVADRDPAHLADVAQTLGVIPVSTDVADPAAMEALAAVARDARLVCLNAGIVGRLGAPWELSPTDWETVFAVNMGGVINGLRAFVPLLLESAEPAHILITASLAGLASFPGNGAYGPSKSAVVAIAEQAAFALSGTAIGVTVLCPALVRTGMSEIGVDPLDVADDALAAVAAGKFLVAPEEWHEAITERVARLVAGRPVSAPILPGAD